MADAHKKYGSQDNIVIKMTPKMKSLLLSASARFVKARTKDVFFARPDFSAAGSCATEVYSGPFPFLPLTACHETQDTDKYTPKTADKPTQSQCGFPLSL